MCLPLLHTHEPADDATKHARHVANCPPSDTANRAAQFSPATDAHIKFLFSTKPDGGLPCSRQFLDLRCRVSIVPNKTANAVLSHGEHLIKGSYAVTVHVEMQLYLRQSQTYGLLCADFRENSYKPPVGRWVDLLCLISPTPDYKRGQY